MARAGLMNRRGGSVFPARSRRYVRRGAALRPTAGGDLYAYITIWQRLIRSIESLVGKFAKTMPNQTGQNEAAVGAFVFRLLGKLGRE